TAHADLEQKLYEQLVTAWQAGDHATVVAVGKEYVRALETGEVPEIGPLYKDITYVIGMGNYKAYEAATVPMSSEDYQKYVVDMLERNISVDQGGLVNKLSYL